MKLIVALVLQVAAILSCAGGSALSGGGNLFVDGVDGGMDGRSSSNLNFVSDQDGSGIGFAKDGSGIDSDQDGPGIVSDQDGSGIGSAKDGSGTTSDQDGGEGMFQPKFNEMGLDFAGVEKRLHGRVARAAKAKKDGLWDYGVIPYEVHGNFSGRQKAIFKRAMRNWENSTCLKFVERDPNEHRNYFVFQKKPTGCSTNGVGKVGKGRQEVTIGWGCGGFNQVLHELGHVIGFYHEQNRPDRDDYVTVIEENIIPGKLSNFKKLTEKEVNSLGFGYDYESIMHYGPNYNTKGDLDSIVPIVTGDNKESPKIGQRIRLSEGDIAQANHLYKCYRCGRTLQGNFGTFSSPAPNSLPPNDDKRCEWRITSALGEKIVLNITEIDIFSSDNCETDYLEIRDGYWHKSPVLGRFCGSERINDVITTTGGRMLVTYITSNRQNGHRGFTANYEAVCGGDLELGDEGGILESPNYPGDYQPNKECIWRISGPKAYQLNLTFPFFEVENHDNCDDDYVEIRDGHSLDSPIIGGYCGNNLPPTIVSTGNQLLVKFISNGSVQKAGFLANITITNETLLTTVEMPFYIQNPTTDMVLDIKDSNQSSKAQIIMMPYNGGVNQLWEHRDGFIYSKLNGLVLDVSGNDKRNLITNAPHGGKNQKWTFNVNGTIKCETGKVMEIRGRSWYKGAQVVAYTDNGKWSQQFRKVYVQSPDKSPVQTYLLNLFKGYFKLAVE